MDTEATERTTPAQLELPLRPTGATTAGRTGRTVRGERTGPGGRTGTTSRARGSGSANGRPRTGSRRGRNPSESGRAGSSRGGAGPAPTASGQPEDDGRLDEHTRRIGIEGVAAARAILAAAEGNRGSDPGTGGRPHGRAA